MLSQKNTNKINVRGFGFTGRSEAAGVRSLPDWLTPQPCYPKQVQCPAGHTSRLTEAIIGYLRCHCFSCQSCAGCWVWGRKTRALEQDQLPPVLLQIHVCLPEKGWRTERRNSPNIRPYIYIYIYIYIRHVITVFAGPPPSFKGTGILCPWPPAGAE